MIKVYFAGAYSRGAEFCVFRTRLEEINAPRFKVTSRWIDHPNLAFREQAQLDMSDLGDAELVIFFTDVPSTKGGFHTEFGLAVGWEKRIAIVGPQLNVFHYLPRIEVYTTFAELLAQYASQLPHSAETRA